MVSSHDPNEAAKQAPLTVRFMKAGNEFDYPDQSMKVSVDIRGLMFQMSSLVYTVGNFFYIPFEPPLKSALDPKLGYIVDAEYLPPAPVALPLADAASTIAANFNSAGLPPVQHGHSRRESRDEVDLFHRDSIEEELPRSQLADLRAPGNSNITPAQTGVGVLGRAEQKSSLKYDNQKTWIPNSHRLSATAIDRINDNLSENSKNLDKVWPLKIVVQVRKPLLQIVADPTSEHSSCATLTFNLDFYMIKLPYQLTIDIGISDLTIYHTKSMTRYRVNSVTEKGMFEKSTADSRAILSPMTLSLMYSMNPPTTNKFAKMIYQTFGDGMKAEAAPEDFFPSNPWSEMLIDILIDIMEVKFSYVDYQLIMDAWPLIMPPWMQAQAAKTDPKSPKPEDAKEDKKKKAVRHSILRTRKSSVFGGLAYGSGYNDKKEEDEDEEEEEEDVDEEEVRPTAAVQMSDAERALPPSFGEQFIHVAINKLSIDLLNDAMHAVIPVVHMETKSLIFDLQSYRQFRSINLKLDLRANYYNDRLVRWEPMLEPWNGTLTFNSSYDAQAYMEAFQSQQNIEKAKRQRVGTEASVNYSRRTDTSRSNLFAAREVSQSRTVTTLASKDSMSKAAAPNAAPPVPWPNSTLILSGRDVMNFNVTRAMLDGVKESLAILSMSKKESGKDRKQYTRYRIENNTELDLYVLVKTGFSGREAKQANIYKLRCNQPPVDSKDFKDLYNYHIPLDEALGFLPEYDGEKERELLDNQVATYNMETRVRKISHVSATQKIDLSDATSPSLHSPDSPKSSPRTLLEEPTDRQESLLTPRTQHHRPGSLEHHGSSGALLNPLQRQGSWGARQSRLPRHGSLDRQGSIGLSKSSGSALRLNKTATVETSDLDRFPGLRLRMAEADFSNNLSELVYTPAPVKVKAGEPFNFDFPSYIKESGHQVSFEFEGGRERGWKRISHAVSLSGLTKVTRLCKSTSPPVLVVVQAVVESGTKVLRLHSPLTILNKTPNRILYSLESAQVEAKTLTNTERLHQLSKEVSRQQQRDEDAKQRDAKQRALQAGKNDAPESGVHTLTESAPIKRLRERAPVSHAASHSARSFSVLEPGCRAYLPLLFRPKQTAHFVSFSFSISDGGTNASAQWSRPCHLQHKPQSMAPLLVDCSTPVADDGSMKSLSPDSYNDAEKDKRGAGFLACPSMSSSHSIDSFTTFTLTTPLVIENALACNLGIVLNWTEFDVQHSITEEIVPGNNIPLSTAAMLTGTRLYLKCFLADESYKLSPESQFPKSECEGILLSWVATDYEGVVPDATGRVVRTTRVVVKTAVGRIDLHFEVCLHMGSLTVVAFSPYWLFDLTDLTLCFFDARDSKNVRKKLRRALRSIIGKVQLPSPFLKAVDGADSKSGGAVSDKTSDKPNEGDVHVRDSVMSPKRADEESSDGSDIGEDDNEEEEDDENIKGVSDEVHMRSADAKTASKRIFKVPKHSTRSPIGPIASGGRAKAQMFSFREKNSQHNLCVTSARYLKGTSKEFVPDTIGFSGQLNIQTEIGGHNGELNLGVHIGMGMGNFHRTKMVTFVPFYVLINGLGQDVRIRQRGIEKVEAHHSSIFTLKPGERSSFHWVESSFAHVIEFKRLGSDYDEWGWSGGVSLDEAGDVEILVPSRTNSSHPPDLSASHRRVWFARVKVRRVNSTNFITLSEVPGQEQSAHHIQLDSFDRFEVPFSIENRSHLQHFRFRQAASSEDEEDRRAWTSVPPCSLVPYAWEQPGQRRLLQVQLGLFSDLDGEFLRAEEDLLFGMSEACDFGLFDVSTPYKEDPMHHTGDVSHRVKIPCYCWVETDGSIMTFVLSDFPNVDLLLLGTAGLSDSARKKREDKLRGAKMQRKDNLVQLQVKVQDLLEFNLAEFDRTLGTLERICSVYSSSGAGGVGGIGGGGGSFMSGAGSAPTKLSRPPIPEHASQLRVMILEGTDLGGVKASGKFYAVVHCNCTRLATSVQQGPVASWNFKAAFNVTGVSPQDCIVFVEVFRKRFVLDDVLVGSFVHRLSDFQCFTPVDRRVPLRSRKTGNLVGGQVHAVFLWIPQSMGFMNRLANQAHVLIEERRRVLREIEREIDLLDKEVEMLTVGSVSEFTVKFSDALLNRMPAKTPGVVTRLLCLVDVPFIKYQSTHLLAENSRDFLPSRCCGFASKDREGKKPCPNIAVFICKHSHNSDGVFFVSGGSMSFADQQCPMYGKGFCVQCRKMHEEDTVLVEEKKAQEQKKDAPKLRGKKKDKDKEVESPRQTHRFVEKTVWAPEISVVIPDSALAKEIAAGGTAVMRLAFYTCDYECVPQDALEVKEEGSDYGVVEAPANDVLPSGASPSFTTPPLCRQPTAGNFRNLPGGSLWAAKRPSNLQSSPTRRQSQLNDFNPAKPLNAADSMFPSDINGVRCKNHIKLLSPTMKRLSASHHFTSDEKKKIRLPMLLKMETVNLGAIDKTDRELINADTDGEIDYMHVSKKPVVRQASAAPKSTESAASVGSQRKRDKKEKAYRMLSNNVEQEDLLVVESAIYNRALVLGKPSSMNFMANSSLRASIARHRGVSVKERSNMRISCTLPHVGASVVTEEDSRIEEIVYFSIKGLKVSFEDTASDQLLELQVAKMQLDNQSEGDFAYPIVLAATPVIQEDLKPVIQLSFNRQKEVSSLILFRYFSLLIQKLDVMVEEKLIHKVLNMFGLLLSVSEAATEQYLLQKHDAWLVVQDEGNASKVYFKFLQIHPLAFDLSFITTPSLRARRNRGFNTADMIINFIGASVGSVDRAPIRLSGKIFENVGGYGNSLASSIGSVMLQQLLRQAYKIAGSIELLGNPLGLVNDLSTGVTDFFYEPAKGLMKSPRDFGHGLAKGTVSIIKNTLTGVFSAASKITQTVGKSMAVLSMDEKFIETTTRRNVEVGCCSNFQTGSLKLAEGIFFGVTGIVTEPIVELRRVGANTVIALIKGLGRGLVGIVIKPTVGVVNFVTYILHAFGSATTFVFEPDKIINEPVRAKR